MHRLSYKFAIGEQVSIAHLGVNGVVAGIHLGEDKRIQVDVKYVGHDQSAQRNWFVESQLAPVEAE